MKYYWFCYISSIALTIFSLYELISGTYFGVGWGSSATFILHASDGFWFYFLILVQLGLAGYIFKLGINNQKFSKY